MAITAEEVIKMLGLIPHEREGGYFRETYRADEMIPPDTLPPRYGSTRAFGTAIYYLLTPETCSIMHRVASDEIFHFYQGDPVEMLQLHPDGTGEVCLLGNELGSGHRFQVVVPRGTWQGSHLSEGGTFALMGATVAPGFDFSDYQAGNRDDLLERYSGFREMITRLTPPPGE